ncbi:DUF4157 domain-containing protein [Actinoplanes sp. NPDC048967]|uniref:WXG100-like domain-containing protein n=1 Tax=Actinoplanes sp. NPDC048967 TaxID=3155269 RepID=UPI00340DF90A
MADNPLIAAPSARETSPWAGVWIAEDIEQIISGVQNGSWIDGTLGVVGAGLDGLALVSDPVGALLQYGIAWLIEHVKPLSEALDWLAGDPAQIAAHAQTWRNMAAELREQSDQLVRSVRWDVSEWTGRAGEAYRRHAERRAHTLLTLSRAAEGTALITEGAGMVIGTVRLMVRDAIATVVSRLIVYAGELIATAGVATPLVAEQVTTLCAAWAAKIARWLKSLISSLRELGEAMRRLGDRIIELRRGATDAPATPHAGGPPFFSKSPVRTNRDVLDNGPGTPMTSENVQSIAQRMGIDLDEVDVVIISDPEEIRYLDHMDAGAYTPSELNGTQIRLGPASFTDEEALAATIAHEHTHIQQQRDGEHLSRPLRELEDEAYASEGPALERLRNGQP